MSDAESIRFSGTTFRRYPDSANWADRMYFTPGIADRKRGVRRLHEEIWKAAHGPIPKGHDIHHADFNPLNNELDNLVCLTKAQHAEAHGGRWGSWGRSPEGQAHLDRIRPLAAAWHSSPEGIAWHRQHAARMGFGSRDPRVRTCDHCGSEYETTSIHGGERFCSNKCKTRARYASGVDNVQRTCTFCGGGFTVNRYSPTACCGRSCAQRLRAGHSRPGI